MNSDSILATYWIETPLSLEDAAHILGGEQSSGTFVKLPGETEALQTRHRAKVVSIKPLEPTDAPSLPGARPSPDGLYRCGEVVIEFPSTNMGTNLPTLMATVAGNLFELRELSGIRLLDLQLPSPFGPVHPGPQFGIAGTRRLADVHERPIIGTIIKPSVGLSPEQNAELVRELAEAGIDFIKDDELMANGQHSPFERRVEHAMRVINHVADRTGKKVMYAFNISDDVDTMKRNHDFVLEHGGTCVMVSLNSVGLTGVMALRRHSQLPIHGHRNGWGMLTRHPALGLAFQPYQTFWRLAGVDQLHCNALQNKFWEPDASVVQSVRTCLTPMFGDDRLMPVLSSGQWGGQAPDTYRSINSVDVMYLAGGGIMAHPGGPRAGFTAIRQAWDAAVAGIPLNRHAAEHPELQQAITKFGRKS